MHRFVRHAVIRLKKTSVIIDQDEVEPLRCAFANHHCVLLRGLLDRELLDLLAPRLAGQPWVRKIHPGIGAEDVLNDALAVSLLDFVANSPAFLDAVRRISGRAGVARFKGRVYRLVPDSADYDSWHSDAAEQQAQRLVGMSVNLGARAYAGGVLQMRDEATGRITCEIANTGWGDATLFDLSGGLKHRVTPVAGAEPRIAYAGWFTSGTEDHFASLRRAAA